jgi:cellulose synthase/poly-beta-1,6-N-acetylglucosamine synthase-like glycosyltransferase
VPLTSLWIAAIPLAIWLYLAFLRGNFWRLEEDSSNPKPLEKWPHVVAIIPARNEAATIARAVTSLLAQEYPGEFEIVVVDDHSDDGPPRSRGKRQKELVRRQESQFTSDRNFRKAGLGNFGP